MPAVLIPLYRRDNIPEEKMLEAMFVASGIGHEPGLYRI